MKPIKFYLKPLAALAAMALALSGNTTQAASDIIVGPSGTQSGLSGSSPDYEWQNMWGNASPTVSFDATTPPLSGDTTGSIYIQGIWAGAAADSYNIGSPGNWYGAVTFDASQYTSIEMDIKYDSTSTITPTSQAHLNIGFDAGYSFIQVTNVSFDASSQTIANGSWHHLSIPIPTTISGAGAVHSVAFYQWNPSATGTMNFWVANVTVVARVLPTPPPTMSPVAKTSKGFNVIFNTPGQYDRHEARLAGNTGKSWVGHATAGNPVSYTFTIGSFPPISVANPSGCISYLFLVPNQTALIGYNAGAPDWNNPYCAVASINQGTNTATMTFQYKVNETNNNGMYGGGTDSSNPTWIYTNAPGSWDGVTTPWYESGNLGSVTVTNNSPAGAAVGTWTLKFTSDTNLTLIAPDGTSSNLVMPPYNAGYFAETTTFDVYLGGQPNQTVALNGAVVYSSFAVSNSVTPFYDNFLTDTVLSTNWDTSVSAGPPGKLVVPATATYWATWTLPAGGFSLETGPSISTLANWTSPSLYAPITMNGALAQLVDSTELPAGNTAFFNLIKRTFTQLQVLLPGQTNAPGTALGYVGTPTPISLAAQGLNPTTVVVNACDSSWHIINGVSDQIHLTTSDGSAYLPTDVNMVNGTATFAEANGILFQSQGSQTVTASDLTSASVTNSATSASVTINP
jgi:hypothetical protein